MAVWVRHFELNLTIERPFWAAEQLGLLPSGSCQRQQISSMYSDIDVPLFMSVATKPVIVASRIDGYAELIGNVDCARLVPPGDDGALAAALLILIANEDLRRRLGACGVEDVRQYDWETIAIRLVDIYQRVQVT